MSGRRIGSGDIAAIVALYKPELEHLGKWSNASDVFLRLVHDVGQPPKQILERGNIVEPQLRKLYRETIGPCREAPGTLPHPRLPFAGGSPDGLNDVAVVEFKSATVWSRKSWGEPMTDKVPDKYVLQCVWLCGIAQRKEAHLVVAFGQDGTDENGRPTFGFLETQPYVIAFDPELFQMCEALVERFHKEHVSPKKPPELKPVNHRRLWKQLAKGQAA
jgi:hypothetical protein